MSISSLVLEIWQFSLIRDWPEIRKSGIPPSEICPISEEWNKLGIPILAGISLIKSYWMLQNARVTAFNVSELLMENRHGERGGGGLPPTQIRVKSIMSDNKFNKNNISRMIFIKIIIIKVNIIMVFSNKPYNITKCNNIYSSLEISLTISAYRQYRHFQLFQAFFS